jgi:hypothetical protein
MRNLLSSSIKLISMILGLPYRSWDSVPSTDVNSAKIRFSENFVAELIIKDVGEGEDVAPEGVVKALIGKFFFCTRSAGSLAFYF